ncbi:hypothetical protein HYPBUDRAFT_151959 [Hyphopichia burtonii NRRL Y-1933]|uniref:Dipeptidyl aminopeptidase n=1 Tax=Hyphopichia burtonii NRRL Y-1933 TaxID=984485 RepID=A0A1E4RMQ6_9ASCO|nr:hypothetical protein HYPBUDRAFT_151959 [Hyphopichia burtonii NRRL Y-1933]ODV68526.1 hypothetical protein HYPBUDRAFT_151959 [Hyphopichia burtonii NRRL Y-1933]
MLFNKSRIEEYELVDQTANLEEGPSSAAGEGELTFQEEEEGGSNSDTSEFFDDIDEFSRKTHQDEDFNSDSKFQTVLSQYEGVRTISKHACGILCGIFVAIWVVAVIVYASNSPKTIIKNLQWQTNVYEMNGENVTLNTYSSSKDNVTLKSYRKNLFLPYREAITWLDRRQYPKTNGNQAGGYYLTKGKEGKYVVKQAHTKFEESLMESAQFNYENNFFYVSDVKLNPGRPFNQMNDNYHILVTDKLPQWRHLTFAIYWLYNSQTNVHIPIQPPASEILKDEKELGGAEILEKLHFAEFSPSGDYVVFGFGHNLYLQSLFDEKDSLVKITENGSPTVYNGKPDWVYEEEVIPDYKLLWWSPDEENLVFATLNDTNVKEYELDYFVKDALEVDNTYTESLQGKVDGVNQYPVKSSIRYPKPGTANPMLSIHNFQLSTKKLTAINIKDDKLGIDQILYDAEWVDSQKMLFKLSDRTSTLLSKKVYEPKRSLTELTVASSIDSFAEYKGWIEKIPPITIIPKPQDENSYVDKVVVNGRIHLGLFDNAGSSNYSKLLTSSGSWDVLLNSPVVYNDIEKTVYFLATIRSTMDAHLVSMNIENGDAKSPQIITGIDKDGFYSVDFSKDGQFLNLNYEGPLQPWQRVINTAELHDYINSRDNKNQDSGFDEFIESHKVINNFQTTKNNLQNVNLPTRVYRKVSVGKNADGTPIELNVIEILPPNFDPKTGKKHPLLVHVYGGPGSTTVTKAFMVEFQDVVSASLDAIVLIIDPRGTGDQNWAFRSFATNNLGFYEPRDIVTVASEYIAANKYIDKYKTAVWGWSYGGFTTLKTLEFDVGQTFKFGMAVAPVTNWLFYDSIYTERYMGLPSTNEKYASQGKISKYDSFKALKRFLLMHGTADDNVHLQNSLWLLDNFNLNEVENYDLHFFPDSDHSIYYHNANHIIFDKLLRWLSDAFSGRFDDL